jgi:hypothetical protein
VEAKNQKELPSKSVKQNKKVLSRKKSNPLQRLAKKEVKGEKVE